MMGEKKQHNIDFYFREIEIGKHTIFHHVKIKATALGLLKVALELFITYFEKVVEDEELTAEEKVEKIKAALRAWDVREKEGDKKAEAIMEMARKIMENATQNP